MFMVLHSAAQVPKLTHALGWREYYGINPGNIPAPIRRSLPTSCCPRRRKRSDSGQCQVRGHTFAPGDHSTHGNFHISTKAACCRISLHSCTPSEGSHRLFHISRFSGNRRGRTATHWPPGITGVSADGHSSRSWPEIDWRPESVPNNPGLRSGVRRTDFAR